MDPHPLIMGQCHFHQQCYYQHTASALVVFGVWWGMIHPSIQPIRSYNSHNHVPCKRFRQVSKYFTDPSGHLTIHPYEPYISHTSLLWGDATPISDDLIQVNDSKRTRRSQSGRVPGLTISQLYSEFTTFLILAACFIFFLLLSLLPLLIEISSLKKWWLITKSRSYF